MDLAKYSTEDLQALKAGNLSKVSTAGLQLLRDDQAQAPGGIDNPHEKSLLPDMERAAGSFGDEAGRIEQLKKNGFSDVRKNKQGDLVAKGYDGKYYRDATKFTEHPVNWAESKLGHALPTSGMVLGAVGGEGVASVPLAAAGAGLGETLRVAAGKHMGTYKGGLPEAAMDVAGETLGGAAAEVGGKAIGKLPLPLAGGVTIDQATKDALAALVSGGSKVATRISQTLTGVDKDAYMRQLMRPNEVKNALQPGNALAVATGAAGEREARDSAESSLISQARQDFREQFGRDPMNTQEFIDAVSKARQRNAPNEFGESAMTPSELSELERLNAQSFVTPRETKPAVTASRVSFEKKPSVLKDASGNAIENVRSAPGPEYTVQPAESVLDPKQSVGSLQRTADWLQKEVPQGHYDKTIPGARSEKSIGTYQELLGKIKDAFHKKDPNGLGRADARYHQYIEKSKVLGPLDRTQGAEGFIDNLFGKNKTAVQEAAQDIIPQHFEKAADIGANKAMTKDPFSKLGPSAPAIIRGGGTLAAAAGGFAASGSLEGGMLGLGGGLGIMTATSPKVHQQLYYLAGKYGMPVIEKVLANPQLAPVLLDTADYNKIKSYGQNIWSSMKEKRQ